MHLMIFSPSPSKRPFFAYLYNSRHTTSSPAAGKGGRKKKSLFWGGCGGHALPDKQSRGAGTVSWHFYMKIEVEEVEFYSNLRLQTMYYLAFKIPKKAHKKMRKKNSA